MKYTLKYPYVNPWSDSKISIEYQLQSYKKGDLVLSPHGLSQEWPLAERFCTRQLDYSALELSSFAFVARDHLDYSILGLPPLRFCTRHLNYSMLDLPLLRFCTRLPRLSIMREVLSFMGGTHSAGVKLLNPWYHGESRIFRQWTGNKRKLWMEFIGVGFF